MTIAIETGLCGNRTDSMTVTIETELHDNSTVVMER